MVGLTIGPEADRNTLIRRVSFNLTGLPPTLTEIVAFLSDQSGSAYENMVERYLASPRYGERWGKHWLDAAGYAKIIVETVGVGQDEVEIVKAADVSVVVLVPGMGDDIQAIKAGIMEIGDIFVVNKADREGADRMAASIEMMLSLEDWPAGSWRPPVLRTVATTGAGVAELVSTIEAFRAQTANTLGTRRRVRAEWRLREILSRSFTEHLERHVLGPGEFDALLDRVAARAIDPYQAAAGVLARAVGAGRAQASPMPLDHVGIAVPDAGPYVALVERLFGLTTGEPERIGLHQVRFTDTGDSTLEWVEPLSADAPVATFLEARGAALHHVCLRVADIDRAIATLKAQGVRMIDEVARAGAHGSRIAFLHPSSAGGLLVELKEPAAGH